LTLPSTSTTTPADSEQQQQQQQPPLYRTMRLLPLSSSGVCVLNAALPPHWGNDLQEANPPGSYWFFEVLLTVRGGGGGGGWWWCGLLARPQCHWRLQALGTAQQPLLHGVYPPLLATHTVCDNKPHSVCTPYPALY